ncbi:MAG: CvpA family protein [Patescibacteria group bacterium]
MEFFDGAILMAFLGFCWFGFWRGLIETAGSIVGIFLGVILASRWYDDLVAFFGLKDNMGVKIAAFIILLILISKLVGALVRLISKTFGAVAILPGFSLLNRLGGLFLGAVEGGLILGVILNFIKTISSGTVLAYTFENSQLVNIFVVFSSWLVPLFPEAVRKFNEIIPK